MTRASDWTASVSRAVGQRIQEARKRRGLSGEEFAQAMTDAGAVMTRSVLASLETGRRPLVNISEVLAAARLLGVPPLWLIFPVGDEGQVEIGPDRMVGTDEAVSWFIGEEPLAEGSQGLEASLGRLLIHRRLLRSWLVELADLKRMITAGADDGSGISEDPAAVTTVRDDIRRTVQHLHLIRRVMADNDEALPPLPAELNGIDNPGGLDRIRGRLDALGIERDG